MVIKGRKNSVLKCSTFRIEPELERKVDEIVLIPEFPADSRSELIRGLLIQVVEDFEKNPNLFAETSGGVEA